ncbi:hypothetical protein Holit_02338 [Hollandina sp. SP2]
MYHLINQQPYLKNGASFDGKAESMAHLHGKNMVYKDHLIIIWPGKFDSLMAMIMEALALDREKDNREFVNDLLLEILEFTCRLLPCEYKNIPVKEFYILCLSTEELKAYSHNPLKYYGHNQALRYGRKNTGGYCKIP